VLALDETLAPSGIRAMSLTVKGTLAPDTVFSPERVAEAVFAGASTADGHWRAEVPFVG
jgi:hypothetical protein